MVLEEQDGVVRVPSEGAVLAGVGAVVDVVGALWRRAVGAAGGKIQRRKINSPPQTQKHLYFMI